MRHLIYFPAYVPVPSVGAWLYIVAHAWEQDFHSCGTVTRTGRGDYNNETFVQYESTKGQQYSNRPL